MMGLEDIKKDSGLLNVIDWEMTPEEAVRLYLEWGNNWARGNYVIRSKDDVTHYFVVNTWKEPIIYLVRRNSDEAVELAAIEMPEDVKTNFMESIGHNQGVYAPDENVRDWLRKELYDD